MHLLKPISSVSNWIYIIVVIVIGLGMITLVFVNSTLQLQISLGLIGLGFISWGLAQVKRVQDEKIDKKLFDQIMTKLDEIQEEIKSEERSKGTGVAIADVITSGLKYYSEQMSKQNKKE
ncbi:hypothetical protein ACFLUZ_03445 [Chloroflexota bacterium]